MTDAPAGITVKSQFFDRPLQLVGTWGADGERPIYSNLLDAVADKIKKKVSSDNQAVVIIYGNTGSGKSNLAMQLIKRLDRNATLDSCYIYSTEDLARKLKNRDPQRINWFDEGSITLNSLGTTSRQGLRFSQFFDTMRFKRYISIICLPNSDEMNKRIEKHADFYIRCPDKAPLWGFANRGFFHVINRIKYDSGKHYDQIQGTGIYRPVPKRMREEYQALKARKAEEFAQLIVREVLSE